MPDIKTHQKIKIILIQFIIKIENYNIQPTIHVVMTTYTPFDVYGNLVKMMGYRNLTLTSDILPKQKLIESLNNYEHVTISGSRPRTDVRDEARARVVMIAPGSKYANKSQDFKKLVKALMKSAGDATEVMFISMNPLTRQIKKYLADDFKVEYPGIYTEDYDYSIFMIEAPAHAQVDKHIIMSRAEAQAFCDRHYLQQRKLPFILAGDTQAVWIGLRPGMVCKIIRVSETAGIAETMRYCVPGAIIPL